ncbi:MAG: roadblock/LC7 domain-containing protein [Myxococcota bacterium]
MMDSQLVLYEEDHRKILTVIGRLVREANAKGVFVVDKNGQLIGEAGEVRGIDSTSLASLTAGSIAATGGLAKIIGEDDFPTHFHQGVRDNLHVTTVAKRIILVVIFDERSSLGLVRLRVKKAGVELERVFEEVRKRADSEGAVAGSPFADITDDDIDNLFAD